MNDGLLVVDKPVGPTSHDAVDEIRKALGVSRVGHSGTLDPPASGLLLIGVGRATRLLTFLQPLPKAYLVEIKFGETTTTLDAAGDRLESKPCSFSREDLERAMLSLTGEIEQVPPMVSAIKVGGEPLYKAARRGEEVERAARTVSIYEFRLIDFDRDAWSAEAEVRCSSGTYVRTLAADLGELMGCGAHVSSLRRTGIGSFGEREAVPLRVLGEMSRSDIFQSMLTPAQALRDFPVTVVDEAAARLVANGRPLPVDTPPAREGELPVASQKRKGDRPPHLAGMTAGVPVAVVDESGRLLAVYRRSRDSLKPAAVLVSG